METRVDGDVLALIGRDTRLRYVASTKGGEWAGPCPLCGEGRDRLRVWPHHPSGHGQWWCRRCERGGDAVAYLVERGEMTPAEAGLARRQADAAPGPGGRAGEPAAPRGSDGHDGRPARADEEPLSPPADEWQVAAGSFVDRCAAALWSPGGERARAWLRARGLADEMIGAARLGYHAEPAEPGAHGWATWHRRRVKLYRGITIPWWAGGHLWRVNIRRPAGDPKYYSPGGWANGLYQADLLAHYEAAVVVESELDALLIAQEAGDLVAAVALGSTSGARRPRWIGALAACRPVLVALDADEDADKGDRAAEWWVSRLRHGRRCRPWCRDPGEMEQAGLGVRAWLAGALDLEAGPAGDADRRRIRRLLQLAETRAFVARLVAEGMACQGYPDWATWLAEIEAES